MKGFINNIEKITLENTNFRRVLYTGKNSQLVVMSLSQGEEIGEEVHNLDQFIKCEDGSGKAVLDGVSHMIETGFAIIVPSGATHNIINTSPTKDLKLYSVYSPPNHKDGTVHPSKFDAEKDEDEHFDGVTTE